MDLSLLIKAIFDPHINRSAWVEKIIKPGDIFDIKVIEVRDDQRALVDVLEDRTRSVTAKSACDQADDKFHPFPPSFLCAAVTSTAAARGNPA